MTNLYEKFFYKYDNDAEFFQTYTALTSAYVLGYAVGEWFMFLMLCSQRWYWEKKLQREGRSRSPGAFQQPETCCGDNILTTIKRLSKLLEVALASVCQYLLFNYWVEWVTSTVVNSHGFVFSRLSQMLGPGLKMFLNVSSGSLMTASGVLVCYSASTLSCCTLKIKPTFYVWNQF